MKNGGAVLLLSFLTGVMVFLESAIFMVGYISNNNLFPEPLTKEEETLYLEKYMRRG